MQLQRWWTPPTKWPRDLVGRAEQQARLVRGILCTDSRVGFDAVERNDSPLLGLSNLRAALQAFQLRDSLQTVGSELRLASDYDLPHALTKKKADCRDGLATFMKTGKWCIRFDPAFNSYHRNKKSGHTAIKEVTGHKVKNATTRRKTNALTDLAHDQPPVHDLSTGNESWLGPQFSRHQASSEFFWR